MKNISAKKELQFLQERSLHSKKITFLKKLISQNSFSKFMLFFYSIHSNLTVSVLKEMGQFTDQSNNQDFSPMVSFLTHVLMRNLISKMVSMILLWNEYQWQYVQCAFIEQSTYIVDFHYFCILWNIIAIKIKFRYWGLKISIWNVISEGKWDIIRHTI